MPLTASDSSAQKSVRELVVTRLPICWVLAPAPLLDPLVPLAAPVLVVLLLFALLVLPD
jgi:hypothetical protein